jgi:cold shock protein
VNDDEPVRGEVVRWSSEEGWGVLRSDAVDGLAFAHFSMIRDLVGYRELTPGQRVWFRWERPGQDGCDVRAEDIWTKGPPFVTEPVPQGPPGAYRSTLTITWDDDPPDGPPPPPP